LSSFQIYLPEQRRSLACGILLVCFVFVRAFNLTNSRGFFNALRKYFLIFQWIENLWIGTS
jgi:hypothetical protein